MLVPLPAFTVDDIEGTQAHTLPCPPKPSMAVERPFAQEQYDGVFCKEVKWNRIEQSSSWP
jgi:hypothetical protein